MWRSIQIELRGTLIATDQTSSSTVACKLQIRRSLSNFPRSSSESTQIETVSGRRLEDDSCKRLSMSVTPWATGINTLLTRPFRL
ncbi:hypothetical protein DA102_028335 [Sinorhizobium meliloti]|nr:hypothetical protein DA102_028335 [Sinorhizobium meliloti]RVH01948.1 hypothetical protein CN216_35155 [Sinorhizobium meliloti]